MVSGDDLISVSIVTTQNHFEISREKLVGERRRRGAGEPGILGG